MSIFQAIMCCLFGHLYKTAAESRCKEDGNLKSVSLVCWRCLDVQKIEIIHITEHKEGV